MAHISILVLQKIISVAALPKKTFFLTAILLSSKWNHIIPPNLHAQSIVFPLFRPHLQSGYLHLSMSLSTYCPIPKSSQHCFPPWDYCQNLQQVSIQLSLYPILPFSGARVLMVICSELLNNFPVLYNRGQNLLHQHQGYCKTKCLLVALTCLSLSTPSSCFLISTSVCLK